MSDRFQPLTTAALAAWIFGELERRGSIFGIPRVLFFDPSRAGRLASTLFGQRLETPFGVAAGPHSQLAGNIVAAWLCGARLIELKTVQELDELEVSKPCIDMQDEGYNVEWSQELRIDESCEEYLRAWVLVHALHRRLGLPGERPGVVFDMSVGYDLAGIRGDKVRRFLGRMADASDRLEPHVAAVAPFCPEVRDVEIPARVSDNVTVSTMHGCPPGEIERICRHLMEDWRLHTYVKLNPTLLGPERVRHVLGERLGYRDVVVPDLAFEHDPKLPEAERVLERLLELAPRAGVDFGVKLCNTLEVENRRGVLPGDQAMAYLSGRPHHALAVGVAALLAERFGDRLPMSFSGGADRWNAPELLACGMVTVTGCSDLLRPGGYGRLADWIEATLEAMDRLGAANLPDLALRAARSRGLEAGSARAAGRANLARYAEAVLDEPALRKDTFDRTRTKTGRELGPFDCIAAPCADLCPIEQRVPEYMALVAEGRPEDAARAIREDNAMAAVLGRACTHACERVCTRVHYDEPLAIREVKRFATEREREGDLPRRVAELDHSVGVVGGGPTALSVAWFLGRAGYPVTIYEARAYLGGMVAGSIPAYRATTRVIEQDLRALEGLGLELRLGTEVGRDVRLDELRERHGSVVLAAGARRGLELGIPGERATGVHDGLELLRAVREGRPPALGARVGVVGGGDVAMDCARTAARLGAAVQVVYRRTVAEMPAGREELEGLLEEGLELLELLAPRRVVERGGRMAGLECARMRLGEPDDSGRRRPVETGQTVELALDTLIVAVGQAPDLGLLAGLALALAPNGHLAADPETLETSVPGLYVGGDLAAHGPETIVRALGDGKRIARAIRERVEGRTEVASTWSELDLAAAIGQRARRARRVPVPRRPTADRAGFDEVLGTLEPEAARAEAARCLRCDLLCSVCAGVCPNRAIQTYEPAPLAASLPTFVVRAGELVEGPPRAFRVEQPYQVAVLTDLCNECGNCTTFCPTAGRPHADKPRLYLRRAELEAERDNAFMLFREDGRWAVEARHHGETHGLVLGERLLYRSPGLSATLDRSSLEVLELAPGPGAAEGRELDLELCAAMATLADGVLGSLPHLPTAPVDEASPLRAEPR